MSSEPSSKKDMVEVILASYNGAEYIEHQLNSILSQKDVEVRIHIFDDASTDRTVSIIQNLMELQKDRIFLHTRHKGSGNAFANFKRAILDFSPTANFIAFSDQDDIWESTKLIRQLKSIRESSAAGCSTSVQAFQGNRSWFVKNGGTQTPIDYLFEAAGQGCTYVLSRELFSEVQNQYPRSGSSVVPHDWLSYMICRAKKWRWSIIDEPLVRYRQHANNQFGSRGSIGGLKKRMQMLWRSDFKRMRSEFSFVDFSLDPIVWDFLSKSRKFRHRFYYSARYCLSFRRQKTHSLLMMFFYLIGKA